MFIVPFIDKLALFALAGSQSLFGSRANSFLSTGHISCKQSTCFTWELSKCKTSCKLLSTFFRSTVFKRGKVGYTDIATSANKVKSFVFTFLREVSLKFE